MKALRIVRSLALLSTLFLAFLVLGCSENPTDPLGEEAGPMAGSQASQGSSDINNKIRIAMKAAPPSISKDATILDWPSEPGGELAVLREGANDWTCIADNEATKERDPLCFDKSGIQWFYSLLAGQPPQLTTMGMVYVMAGSGPASNLFPGAPGPTSDNEWMANVPAHIAIIPADLSALDGVSSDFDNGGNWVMWRGTPYAHMMIPVE